MQKLLIQICGLWLIGLGISNTVAYQIPTHARGGKLEDYILQMEATTPAQPTIAAQFFQQRVDHFNNSNLATFPQRYYVNDQYWSSVDGPIFLYIGGESALNKMPSGFETQLAKEYGAKVVALEHRFYGASIPGNSLATENLRYLAVEQALADLGYFHVIFQRNLPSQINKWFVIGGSYPGALAAWYRIAYPKSSVGSLASSAVVNAIYNYTQFDQQVGIAVGPDCANALRQTTAQLETALAGPEKNNVKELFGASVLSDNDFFYMVADGTAMAVQYGHKDQLCTPMVNALTQKQPLMQTLATFINGYYGVGFGSRCFYDTQCLKNDAARWGDARSWRYQKCSEVAFFQVAPSQNSIRSSKINLQYHEDQCREIFGDGLNALDGSTNLNNRFGGDRPTAHNVFFSNFADDPWQTASVLTALAPDEPAVLAKCDLCGHCNDLSGEASVPLPVQQQRNSLRSYLTQWLNTSPDPIFLRTADRISKTVEKPPMLILLPILILFISMKLVLHVNPVRNATVFRD